MHRKRVRGGQWALLARLELGAAEAVLGLPASRIGSGHAPLEDFWGTPRTARLLEALSVAQTKAEAAALLDRAIHEQLVTNKGDANQSLVLAAADRLERGSVRAVAHDLGVSERHLRRVFRDVVGLSPKTFASLARFRRAIRVARDNASASWASVAATAGYYDQAHLIAEFRAIAGVTPRSLLREVDNG
ncbi:MAG: AraC family transcriptional regulator [Myxococcales bacterium]|nr:AraC family transcriptional regulator [Myxococcales bacterium]